MGDFITSTATPEIFDDKEAAPGLTRRPGWTEVNVLDADDINAIKAALFDCRTAIRAQRTFLVFGAEAVTFGEYLKPGFSDVTSAGIGIPLPSDGVLLSIAIACSENVASNSTAIVFVDGQQADQVDFTGETSRVATLDQGVTAGSVIAVQIDGSGTPLTDLVVSVALSTGTNA